MIVHGMILRHDLVRASEITAERTSVRNCPWVERQITNQNVKEIEMKEFRTMTGEEIMNTPLPQTNFVVSELLPTGVHILGGAPKIGKSWLML